MSASSPPPAPESFARAYGGLRELVEWLARSGPAGAASDVSGRIRAWQNGPCGGSDSLAKAAALAMRHEIAAARLAEGATRSPADDPEYGALREVERALWPPEPEDVPPPVGVDLPPALRERLGPEALAVKLGRVEAIFSPSPTLGAVLSVSHPERPPTLEELSHARLAFGHGAPTLWARLPDEGIGGPPYTVTLVVRPFAQGGAPPSAEARADV